MGEKIYIFQTKVVGRKKTLLMPKTHFPEVIQFEIFLLMKVTFTLYHHHITEELLDKI
jgi:hypothetical protein